MQVQLKLSDGSEETRDVASLSLEVNGLQLEITPDKEPRHLHLYLPGDEKAFGVFVVHHSACNSMYVEVQKMYDADRLRPR